MMNKIKFRVWDKVIKVMREVLSIDFEKQEVICPPRGHEFSEWFNQNLPFNEVLILQNTGLKDKNGKEIYEGDIVEFNNCDYQRTAGHLDDEIIVGEVEYSCGVWGLKEANGQLHDLYISLVNDEEAEVIGNIFQDGDLLRDS